MTRGGAWGYLEKTACAAHLGVDPMPAGVVWVLQVGLIASLKNEYKHDIVEKVRAHPGNT